MADVFIRGEELKALIKVKGHNNSTLAEAINVARETFQRYVSSGKIPTPKFNSIRRILDLTLEDLERVVQPKPAPSLLFRTLRHKTVPDEVRLNIEESVEAFMVLYRDQNPDWKTQHIHSDTRNVEEMANHIINNLKCSHPMSVDQLILQCFEFGIPIFFQPFSASLKEANIDAYTANYENLQAIFVDANEPYLKTSFLILHELCHVFANHGNDVTKEDEEFCNQVASEILLGNYFRQHSNTFKKIFSRGSRQNYKIHAKRIADFLNVEVGSVAIALKNYIDIDKSVLGIIWGFVHQEGSGKTVRELYFPEAFSVSSWKKCIDNPTGSLFLKYYQTYLDALVQEQVSKRTAANVFEIDPPEVTELIEDYRQKMSLPESIF